MHHYLVFTTSVSAKIPCVNFREKERKESMGSEGKKCKPRNFYFVTLSNIHKKSTDGKAENPNSSEKWNGMKLCLLKLYRKGYNFCTI